MKKRHRKPTTKPRSGWTFNARVAVLVGAVVLLAILSTILYRRLDRPPAATYQPHSPGTITFNKDIAPILHQHCASCHHAGEVAPFSLVTYPEVKLHAADIAEVTQRGYMPPWMPEAGFGKFADERRLNAQELGLIQQWVREGSPEGESSDRIPPPQWETGWKLGVPDLVAQLPAPFVVPAAGPDLIRNFVIPLSLKENRFVRAVEIQAGSRAIHHCFIFFDNTQQSRRVDARDAEVGFSGMTLPSTVKGAGGYFLSWQPGRPPIRSLDGMAWPLSTGSDAILQVHMQPIGKPEAIQPTLAFYFTDQAPTNSPFKILLDSTSINIPPGVRDYMVETSYVLPVDVDVLSVLPHAHYLARQIESYALLPNGQKEWLLKIKDWDFNWQSDFRFLRPVPLPRGTRLYARFVYDNSEGNPRNPNKPPLAMTFGQQSTDEMANFSIQMLPRTPADLQTLETDYAQRVVSEILEFNTLALKRDPNNAHAHTQMGTALMVTGKRDEALIHLRRAVELDPSEEEGHYNLGLIAMEDSKAAEAEAAFRQVIRINPENVMARNNLGVVLMNTRRLAEAAVHFQEALRHNPGDEIVKANLEAVAKMRSQKSQ